MSAQQFFLFVVGFGLVNWIATEIVVNSVVFEDVRELVSGFGRRVHKRHPRIGHKITYFTGCCLCVGVWVGFIEALVFGGPLQIHAGWLAWASFIANGLAYKAVGHLLLQVNGSFHNGVELLKQKAALAAHAVHNAEVEQLKAAAEARELAALTAGDAPREKIAA